MQNLALVPVKKAATLLGLNKDELCKKLNAGEIKGEIRTVGDKDKWYVYSNELDILLAQRFPERQDRTTLTGLAEFFVDPVVTEEREQIEQEQGEAAPAAVIDMQARPRGAAIKPLTSLPPMNRVDIGSAVVETLGRIDKPRTPAMHYQPAADLAKLLAGDLQPTVPLRISGPVARAPLFQPVQITEEIQARPTTKPVFEPVQVTEEIEARALSNEEALLSLDEITHSLTIEFAYRLAEERQEIFRLQAQLAERGTTSERIAPLERALQAEVREGCIKSIHIKNLEAQIDSLRTELAKPWWKRLFSP